MDGSFDILASVKTALGITGSYQDGLLAAYIAEVKQYMIDAGVPKQIVNAEQSAGVIARGVTDLWNYGAGNTNLSSYFIQRVIQLSYQAGDIIAEPDVDIDALLGVTHDD